MISLKDFRYAQIYIPIFVVVGLLFAGILSLLNLMQLANQLLALIVFIGLLPFVRDMLISMRRGHFGIDLIAVVGIVASLLIHEYLAGSVILLMLSGGEALERYARRRARKELTHLLSRVPTKAHLKSGGKILDVAVASIVVSDVLVIKPGEIIPVDGVVLSGDSMVDESALTGESLPVGKNQSSNVMSGSVNLQGVLEVKTLKPSAESKYAQIVRLVREAEEQKAPFVRMADQYSVFFTIVSFGLAGLAWLISGDPVRALAVLVVATPCPLILATPIAFTSGMSRAALRGIIVKSGEAIEKLAEAKSFVFDKTGTITLGIPRVVKISTFSSLKESEVERIAASLDQLSAHILAASLVTSAREAGEKLVFPEDFSEKLGYGVEGKIEGKKYFFGKLSFLTENKIKVSSKMIEERSQILDKGIIPVYLGGGGKPIGVVFFADEVRQDVKLQFEYLSKFVDKIIMVTGDRLVVARAVAERVGITEVRADRLPEQKLADIHELQQNHGPVVMVGDGINDAPALAAADVGIVLGSTGSTAAHEAGDIVVTVDQFDRIPEIFQISRHVLNIAKQGIAIGIGLSIMLMVLAALGFIKPVLGALLQEIIDVLVILNALRVNAAINPRALPRHEDHQ